MFADLEIRDAPKDFPQCAVISPDLCKILNKDPFTIVLSIWAAFQLSWVTMLLCVQLLQIARNLTTYESMRGHLHNKTPADALNTFVTTSTTLFLDKTHVHSLQGRGSFYPKDSRPALLTLLF